MPSMPLSLRNFALCIARLQFSAFLITLLVLLAVFVFPQITQGQTLKADYQFQNTRASFIGNSTLTDTGFNTFQTDTVDGNSRSVLRFPFNNGLQLSAATGLIPSNSYTIVMLFKVDSVSGFVRLIDFKNRTTDNGLYILNGQLELCQTCSTIPANTYVQVVFTRSSSGIFAGYVNGVPQGQGPDANNDFVINASNILNFFQDDLAIGNEASAGSVARIRLYDAPLSSAQVSALDRLPAPITDTLTAQDCSQEPNLKSLNSNTPSAVEFVNNTSETVRVSWLDFNGQRVLFATLPAGGSYLQPTFVTHPWIVIGTSLTCYGIYLPAATPARAVITAVFTIRGRVVDDAGNPVAGVTINLSGAASAGTTTDGNGEYTFANLSSGNYTVTPSASTHLFSPTNRTFNNLNTNSVANFVGTRTLVTLSGRISDASNVGINNVTVSLTKNGAPHGITQTDALGNYSFGNLAIGATYMVMPTGSFLPLTQSFNNLSRDVTANFQTAPIIPPQCGTVSFAAATNFAVGSSPFTFVVGDVNGDGEPDLAVANRLSSNVSILLGSGSGSFSVATNFTVGTLPQFVAVGDFNADDNLDLVVVNNGSANVSILLGTGTGSFGAATNLAVGINPEAVVVEDFNGDGKTDLAVANGSSNNVSILLGTGTGSFSGATDFAVGVNPRSVATGDFNGDGRLDLAVANRNSNNVSILLGTGTGSFSAASNFAVALSPRFVVVADLSGDAKLDLAVPSFNSGISILLGTGTGSFSAATNVAVGSGTESATVGDFNGDGKLDLAAANSSSNNVSVLLGTGAGSFGAPTNFPVGSSPTSIAVGDFNNDGKLDFAASNDASSNVSIRLNNGTTCNTQSSISISGQLRKTSDQPLAGIAVTLSGPITLVVSTDANGNYLFPNLIPGGNFAVTVQSPYYVFAPSRVDFFNLSSNQTANFTAAPVVVPSPLPPPSDDFSGTVRDASKWSLGTVTLPPGSFDPRVDVRQVNGQLVISPLAQVSGRHYNGYVSANSFDMRGGSISVELVRPASGGADTIFAIGSDSNDFYRFLVHTPGAPSAIVNVVGPDGVERPLDEAGTQLIFQVGSGGTPIAIPYDPVLHRFKRFRHDAPANEIVFETSPNNIDFTERHRVTLTRSVSALTVELSAGTSNPANPGSAVFDNLSLVVSTFQFSSANYTVNEGISSILITVTRSGSTAGTATVDYATVDGTATQSSRYINAAGRLTFAAGEASRTFRILIVDNVLTEGDQNLNLMLQDPMGPGLNTPGRAVLTIVDNDSVVPESNPLDVATFYVTQHYYDFLNREPDASGLAFWVNEITSCNGEPSCLERKRINVSAAYFLSIEFQETGFLVHRFYNAALNRSNGLPRYLEFFRDTQAIGRGVVVGAPGYEALLEANKVAYAIEFAARAEFTALYSSTQTPEQFVDALYAHAGITPGAEERQAAIAEFNNPTGARGRVVRRVAENPTLRARELNRAFVLAQYFGYLRRNPDDAPDNNLDGYNFWLGKLNQFNGNFVSAEMVKAFITSGEYRHRFGP